MRSDVAYFAMDEGGKTGYYTGVIEFTIKVAPDKHSNKRINREGIPEMGCLLCKKIPHVDTVLRINVGKIGFFN